MNKTLALLFMLSSAASAEHLPDRKYTYGTVFFDTTKERICVPGYSSSVRNVSKSSKNKVFKEYDTSPLADSYEIDHLIPLELGGSNSINNLWPQSYTIDWNAHDKDKLENRLHKLVCFGIVPLEQAQFEIATDWIAAYKKYVGVKQ